MKKIFLFKIGYFSREKMRNVRVCFGPYFLKLFLRTVFENTKNTIFVFSKNCSCFLDLMFAKQ